MFVNTDLLHTGADDSRRGGSPAGEGADHLARTAPAAAFTEMDKNSAAQVKAVGCSFGT